MSETILISGGAGFIGSHLCDALVDDYKVLIVDNLSTGRRKNVDHLLEKENFELIKHDVIEPLNIPNDIDYLFHMASRASPVDYQEHPVHTLRTNSEGVFNMLKLAYENDATFLYASTSEVYGNPEEHPQPETYNGNVNPNGPRACYDEAKRFGEASIAAFSKNKPLDWRIVRIFNTYGPRMRPDDGRVISTFINQALNGQPLTVHGTGKQTRSFCYVEDMVEGLKKMMFRDETEQQIINLGNPEEVSIAELANMIRKYLDGDSEIVHEERPEDDPERRKPDISKAKRVLDWTPETGLEEGLKKTIDEFSTKYV